MKDEQFKPEEPFDPEKEKLEYEKYKDEQSGIEYKGEKFPLKKKEIVNSTKK